MREMAVNEEEGEAVGEREASGTGRRQWVRKRAVTRGEVSG